MKYSTFKFSELTVQAGEPENAEEIFNQLVSKDNNHPDVLDERIPYWTEIWPSSIGLSRFISEHRELVDGKDVLELGCGCGLPGIVAGMCGGNVEFTDYLPEAIDLASTNWKLNLTTTPKVSLLDWREPGNKKADVILASDIAYEGRSFDPITNTLKSLLSPRGIILLSEPNRVMASEFIKDLSKHFSITKSNYPVTKYEIDYSISVYLLQVK
jgi:predicted nicotinamide N-methyase